MRRDLPGRYIYHTKLFGFPQALFTKWYISWKIYVVYHNWICVLYNLIGSARGRSPSPHKMMLETSFCGNKPIPTKSMDMESPPKEEARAVSTGNVSALKPRSPPKSPKSPREFDRRKQCFTLKKFS